MRKGHEHWGTFKSIVLSATKCFKTKFQRIAI